MTPSVTIPTEQLAEFARRWSITELSLFGSILRDDFGPDSDVDCLVTFAPGTSRRLADHVAMQEELEAIFGGRRVDLLQSRYLRNPFLRSRVLSTRRVIYAA